MTINFFFGKMRNFYTFTLLRMALFCEASQNLQGQPHSGLINLRFQSFRPRNWSLASDRWSCGPVFYVGLVSRAVRSLFVQVRVGFSGVPPYLPATISQPPSHNSSGIPANFLSHSDKCHTKLPDMHLFPTSLKSEALLNKNVIFILP